MPNPIPIQVFIAYSRRDSTLLEKLRTHLTPLTRSGRVKVWYDGELAPGAVWEADIKKHLHGADIILLLVSADAIASDYFYEKEMSDALERHTQGMAHVVPLILRSCAWKATPLAHLQAIPKNGQPVTTWTDHDDAFANAVESLDELVKKIDRTKNKEPEKPELQISPKKPKESNPLAGEMILVKGGTFQMGEKGIAEPVHPVAVSDFYIGKYPVTQKQWRAVMGSDPLELSNKGCGECPVEGVSWDDLRGFIQMLNEKTGQNYRLPTEAEWEYAATGGAVSIGYQYAGSNNLDEVAVYSGNSGGKSNPVGKKKPNELGLFDMTGNVWELCEDDWHSNYEGAPSDGRAWVDSPRGVNRVFRGGSWDDYAEYCRVAFRGHWSPADRFYGVGFRLVLQL